MAPQIGAAKAQISEVADFFGLVFLRVAWVGGCGRDHEVVDDVAVVRIIDGDGSVAFLGKIQNIFVAGVVDKPEVRDGVDRKSTRLNSSHVAISYAVFCL